jgi:MFS family permease
MLQDYKKLLKNKNFLYIWISQMLSQITINIMNFVLLTRLFEVTGSAISTSLLWIAYALPAMLIGPFAAGIIDLVDKRKVLMITNFLQAVTIFLYAIASKSSIFLLYEIVFIYSFLNQFYVPSETSTLPSVLDKKKLVHGNSLFFITQQASLVLGFAAAGLLKGLLGFKNTLFFCAFLVFVAFISTTLLPKTKVVKIIPQNVEDALFGFFRHIMDGYNFIKNERKILTPLLLLLGFQVGLQLCIVQFPAFARDILLIPLNTAGIYILVPAGMGAVIGALIIPKILKRDIRKKTVIDFSLLAIGVSVLMITYIMPLFGYTIRVMMSFLLLAIMGVSFVGVLVPSQTFLQEWTPAGLRGRVFGSFWFLVTIASVLPVLFSGTVIELLGIKFMLFALAAFVLIIYCFSKRYGSRFLTG